jgi:hypothetical protein
MNEIATILSHFKGYPQCVDAFIEQSQMVRWFDNHDFVWIFLRMWYMSLPPIPFLLIWSSKLWSSLLCNFLHFPLLESNIFFSILVTDTLSLCSRNSHHVKQQKESV